LIDPFVSAVQEDEDLNQHTQEIFDVISVCVASDEALKSGAEVKVEYV